MGYNIFMGEDDKKFKSIMKYCIDKASRKSKMNAYRVGKAYLDEYIETGKISVNMGTNYEIAQFIHLLGKFRHSFFANRIERGDFVHI